MFGFGVVFMSYTVEDRGRDCFCHVAAPMIKQGSYAHRDRRPFSPLIHSHKRRESLREA
jgi:hypothetical protein